VSDGAMLERLRAVARPMKQRAELAAIDPDDPPELPFAMFEDQRPFNEDRWSRYLDDLAEEATEAAEALEPSDLAE